MTKELPIGHCASLSCVVFHTREHLRARRLKKCPAVFCRWCGNYVPFGDANVRGEAVQIEIRLAKLLSEMADQYEGAALEEAYEILTQVFAASSRDECLMEDWCPCPRCLPRQTSRPRSPIELMVDRACGIGDSA